jgi:hypothetical protein
MVLIEKMTNAFVGQRAVAKPQQTSQESAGPALRNRFDEGRSAGLELNRLIA